MNKRTKQYQEFIKQKHNLQASLASDMQIALDELGENIKLLEWFPRSPEEAREPLAA